MKTKNLKITYWVFTLLFCLFFLADGAMGIMQIEEGQEIMVHLGYPLYPLPILGVAKFLGALAILQNKFHLLKEWAYAGFTFHFIGACISRAAIADGWVLIISPILFLGIMLISYYLWKKGFPSGQTAKRWSPSMSTASI
jgi:hypothetical protein